MANKIQFRRGVKANLPILSVAEPAFTTDTNEFFVGNGTSNIKLAKQSDLDLANASLSEVENKTNHIATDSNGSTLLDGYKIKLDDVIDDLYVGSVTNGTLGLAKNVTNYNTLLFCINKINYGLMWIKVYSYDYPRKFSSTTSEYFYFNTPDGTYKFYVNGTNLYFNNAGIAVTSPVTLIRGKLERSGAIV
ncbi:hypothetical protein [Clostridium beijerinckii]|uniref:Major tropism determinant N-terminal domain-containing protein n=1 Tax=Clostridium beijerinckii TaxID=1520 RepID=A0A1S8SAF1_CLOBE|nr:hypothetical protein [Clostridium beijerinckii]NRY59840.1 hypothetical protein [Clostridium beijerinckii]OOM62195.1 hypothetical protein CLBCK_18980 [Clostridium beijerinckii]